MNTSTGNCPYCEKTIELPVKRWSTEEICPECKNVVYIDFDMYLITDEAGDIIDEDDFYVFKKIGDV